MKHFLFSALCILLFFSAAAQGTEPYCSVFTTDDGGNDKLWRVKIATPAVYESITDALDAHALFPGYHKGPVSISRNGEWFIFRSTRFDGESAANGEAITIAKTDMSVIETPKNPNPSWYYGEGMLQVSNDGQTILYVDAGTSHSRDVFKVEKVTATSWGTPVNLTGTSPYDYNTYPRFSYDATNRIVFNASNDPYIASNLGLTDLSGNVSMLIAATDISGCDLVNSGNLLADGSLYFEGETDAERIWVKNSSGTISALNTTMTNDNSPVFAGSKIVSLQLPNSLHHLKVMNPDGSGAYMLTSSNSFFSEIMDIGIDGGKYLSSPALALENAPLISMNVYPNPNQGRFEIQVPELNTAAMMRISDLSGKVMYQGSLSPSEKHYSFDLPLQNGIYFLTLSTENAYSVQKLMVK